MIFIFEESEVYIGASAIWSAVKGHFGHGSYDYEGGNKWISLSRAKEPFIHIKVDDTEKVQEVKIIIRNNAALFHQIDEFVKLINSVGIRTVILLDYDCSLQQFIKLREERNELKLS